MIILILSLNVLHFSQNGRKSQINTYNLRIALIDFDNFDLLFAYFSTDRSFCLKELVKMILSQPMNLWPNLKNNLSLFTHVIFLHIP